HQRILIDQRGFHQLCEEKYSLLPGENSIMRKEIMTCQSCWNIGQACPVIRIGLVGNQLGKLSLQPRPKETRFHINRDIHAVPKGYNSTMKKHHIQLVGRYVVFFVILLVFIITFFALDLFLLLVLLLVFFVFLVFLVLLLVFFVFLVFLVFL